MGIGAVAFVATAILLLFSLAPTALAADQRLMIALDGSRSMWGTIGGLPKYLMVHRGFSTGTDPENAPAPQIGLVVFGNRSPSSCSDVTVAVSPDDGDRKRLLSELYAVRPWGMTPQARALKTAAGQFSSDEPRRNIVLITDGTDNCRGDPCALAATLADEPQATTIDVIALDVPTTQHRRLACIAAGDGGAFYPVGNQAEFDDAVAAILKRISVPVPAEQVVASAAQTPAPPHAERAPKVYPRGTGHPIVEIPPFRPTFARDGVDPPLPSDHPHTPQRDMAWIHPVPNPLRESGPEPAAIDPIVTGSVPATTAAPSDGVPQAGAPPPTETAARIEDPDRADVPAAAQPEVDIQRNDATGEQGLALSAKLTASMRPISRPVQWSVFAITGEDRELWTQAAALRVAEATLELAPGDYYVEARYGHASASRAVTVTAGEITDATFVLNAGGLRVLSHLVFLDAPETTGAVHYVYSGERDANGMRQLIARSQIQGEIIRLNAGRYHLVSRLGGANSVVETDVDVNPGILTAVEVNHKAGVVTLTVAHNGDEADPAPVLVTLLDETGATIARIEGRTGHAILAPGSYTVVAESDGRTTSEEFQIRIGEAKALDLELR